MCVNDASLFVPSLTFPHTQQVLCVLAVKVHLCLFLLWTDFKNSTKSLLPAVTEHVYCGTLQKFYILNSCAAMQHIAASNKTGWVPSIKSSLLLCLWLACMRDIYSWKVKMLMI